MSRFDGMVAVVTGGASGIGAASARQFAGEGAQVVVVDTNEGKARAVAEEIAGVAVVFDVGRSSDWAALRQLINQRFGRLDVIHHNAYVDCPGSAHNLAEEDWDRVLTVDLKAAYLGTKHLIELLQANTGNIVLTSSVHALIGLPGRPAYAAAKGGLCSLGRQLAVEYAPAVRVNTVLPGPVLTAAWDNVSQTDQEWTAQATLAGRLGHPEEVAAAVAFLASTDASFITGATLLVDGGWMVHKESV